MTVPPSQLPPRSLSDLNPQDPEFALQAVDLLIPLVISRGASDLHLHPRAGGWDVMLRVDGVLSVTDCLPRGGTSDPVTRLMVLAGLPTYRSSQPMEGRLKWNPGDSSDLQLSMRLGVYPTVHGPRAVVRILRRDTTFDSIESLGLPTDVSESLVALSEQTDGAVFLSGPAGSGKATTMYALLRRIASSIPRRSVMTIEDPVESVIDTISQCELDPSVGMKLASALRSAVRQDSEVWLVSEIRDPETAEAAMQASLTGHLIFSSLHASDVAASLRRLTQLGVPVYALRSGLRAVLSQRLLRRLCTICSGHEIDPSCQGCLGTGYRGRLAIAQWVWMGATRCRRGFGKVARSGRVVGHDAYGRSPGRGNRSLRTCPAAGSIGINRCVGGLSRAWQSASRIRRSNRRLSNPYLPRPTRTICSSRDHLKNNCQSRLVAARGGAGRARRHGHDVESR